MKNYLWFLLFTILAFMGLAYAQDASAPAAVSQIDIDAFLKLVGGLKGAGAMGIVAVVVQGLMLVFKSSFGGFAGKWQTLAVLFLTLVGGVITSVSTGSTWGVALLNSATLAALQVFVHQLITQEFPSKA